MTVELKTLAELEAFEAGEGVVLYGATWCGPCKQFKPHFLRAAEEFNIPFAFVYIDELEGTTEAEQFVQRGIQSVPAVRYFYKDMAFELKERRILPFIKELTEASS